MVAKVGGAILTLGFVLCFNFFLFRIVQPDPVATLFRGRNISAEKRAELTAQFGLNQPLPIQFSLYLRETSRLNLGLSYQSRRPVSEEILSKVWPTVALVGTSAVLSAVIGIAAGIVSGWHRGTTTDYALTGSTMLFYSMPDFWLGMLLLVGLAVIPGWFPVGGIVDPRTPSVGLAALLDYLHHLTLPALTLTLAYLGEYTLIMRSSLLDVMGEDYLTVARAKGLRDKLVRNRHAVPNAMLPVVTLLAINLGFVLSGAIAVETLFSWPGLGKDTADAVRGPDLPMLQGLFLFFSAAVIVANLAADLIYGWLDPRVGMSRGGLFRRTLGQFASSRAGMAGVIVLAVFVLLALAAPLLADAGSLNPVTARAAGNPQWGTPWELPPLGTDHLRRSVWAQFVFGARVSLFVGLAATVLTIAIGSVVGITAGYAGGRLDGFLMRITEWFLVIPFLPLAIVLAAILGRSVWNIVFVIGVTSWPSTARLVRAQVLTVKQRLFVERSRSLGAGGWHIVARHILPNVSGLILANTTLSVPISILTETTLSFLGLGDPPQASWGKTLEEAFNSGAITSNFWWYYLPAGIGIVAVVLAFTLIGQTMEEIADPRLRR